MLSGNGAAVPGMCSMKAGDLVLIASAANRNGFYCAALPVENVCISGATAFLFLNSIWHYRVRLFLRRAQHLGIHSALMWGNNGIESLEGSWDEAFSLIVECFSDNV